MMRTIVCLWLITIFGLQPLFSTEAKRGYLKENEIWSGEIHIDGDIVVPEGLTLEIKPGTRLLYENISTQNYGENPDRAELIVYGNLKLPEDQTIQSFNRLKIDQDTQILKIAPYQVDVKGLQEEFNTFRWQYLTLWSVLTIGVAVAIASI